MPARHTVTQTPLRGRGAFATPKRLRVHEAARQNGLSTSELLARCKAAGLPQQRSASSIITEDDLALALETAPEPPPRRARIGWPDLADLSPDVQRVAIRWAGMTGDELTREWQSVMAGTMADDYGGLVTTAEAAALAGVTPAAIRQWRARGYVFPKLLDYRGGPLYARSIVEQAAARASRRSRRAPNGAPDLEALLTVKAAAQWLGVGVSTVRTWAYRGKLAAAGSDSQGRSLYRAGDLAQVEQRTSRALGRR